MKTLKLTTAIIITVILFSCKKQTTGTQQSQAQKQNNGLCTVIFNSNFQYPLLEVYNRTMIRTNGVLNNVWKDLYRKNYTPALFDTQVLNEVKINTVDTGLYVFRIVANKYTNDTTRYMNDSNIIWASLKVVNQFGVTLIDSIIHGGQNGNYIRSAEIRFEFRTN